MTLPHLRVHPYKGTHFDTIYLLLLLSTLLILTRFPSAHAKTACTPEICKLQNYPVHDSTNCGWPRVLLPDISDPEWECCKRTECICFTDHELMGLSSTWKHKNALEHARRYENCTIIDGSVELTHRHDGSYDQPEDGGGDPDLAAEQYRKIFKNVREIKGYLLIYSYKALAYLEFPNLRIIRGQRLLFDDKDKTALDISMTSLKYIAFPKLTKIANGNVKISKHNPNSLICFMASIKWSDEVLVPDTEQSVNIGMDGTTCNTEQLCNTACLIDPSTVSQIKRLPQFTDAAPTDGNRCWSSSPDHCQTFTRTYCQNCGRGKTCYWDRKNGAGICCNQNCAGGCPGDEEAKRCYACERLNREGQCIGDIYSTAVCRVGNKDLSKYGAYCVERCPSATTSQDSRCVSRCLRNYYTDETDNVCRKCKEGTSETSKTDWCFEKHKICRVSELSSRTDPSGKKYTVTPFAELVALPLGCETLVGSLDLVAQSFQKNAVKSGKTKARFTAASVSDILDRLSTIRKITGYLAISNWPYDLAHFCVFRKLEVIKGMELKAGTRSLLVNPFHSGYKTITDLCFYNMWKIEEGNVLIDFGKHPPVGVFYGIREQWKNYLSYPDRQKVEINGLHRTVVRSDIYLPGHAFRDVQPCDSHCVPNIGCWTATASGCVRCASNTLRSTPAGKYYAEKVVCVSQCPSSTYSHQTTMTPTYSESYEELQCTACDYECLTGCTGPTSLDCKFDFHLNRMIEYQKLDESTVDVPENAVTAGYETCYIDNENCAKGNIVAIRDSGCRNYSVPMYNEYGNSVANIRCAKNCEPYDHTWYYDIRDDKSNHSICVDCGKNCIGACSRNADTSAGVATVTCDECSMELDDIEVNEEGMFRVRRAGETRLYPEIRDYIEQFQIDISYVSRLQRIDVFGAGCSRYADETNEHGVRRYEALYECFVSDDSNIGSCDYGCMLLYVEYNTTEEATQAPQQYYQIRCKERESVDKSTTFILITFITIGLPTVIVLLLWYNRRVNILRRGIEKSYIDDFRLQPRDREEGGLVAPIKSDEKPNMARVRTIPKREMKRLGPIGAGAFGEVFKAIWSPRVTGTEKIHILVAEKVIKNTSVTSSSDILEEAKTMASIKCPWLVRLEGIVFLEQSVSLITLFMQHGSLNDYLKKNKNQIQAQNMIAWSLQIARGMDYLTSEKNMVHRDLATRNVLVKTPDHVKITDFGLTKMLDRNQNEYTSEGERVAVKWLAPECFREKTFSVWSDVWAYGVTIWEILMFGERPWQEVKVQHMLQVLEGGERLVQPPTASVDFWTVLIECWHRQPTKRKSFSQLVQKLDIFKLDPTRYICLYPDTAADNHATYRSSETDTQPAGHGRRGLIHGHGGAQLAWAPEMTLDGIDFAFHTERTVRARSDSAGPESPNVILLGIEEKLAQDLDEVYLKPEDSTVETTCGIQESTYSNMQSSSGTTQRQTSCFSETRPLITPAGEDINNNFTLDCRQQSNAISESLYLNTDERSSVGMSQVGRQDSLMLVASQPSLKSDSPAEDVGSYASPTAYQNTDQLLRYDDHEMPLLAQSSAISTGEYKENSMNDSGAQESSSSSPHNRLLSRSLELSEIPHPPRPLHTSTNDDDLLLQEASNSINTAQYVETTGLTSGLGSSVEPHVFTHPMSSSCSPRGAPSMILQDTVFEETSRES